MGSAKDSKEKHAWCARRIEKRQNEARTELGVEW